MMSTDELNEAAMNIIMLAGDSRDASSKAIKATLEDAPDSEIDDLMAQAKTKVVEAHRIQTEIIQQTLEDDLHNTLFFSHAQDTLMTVQSELNTFTYIIQMYRKLKSERS